MRAPKGGVRVNGKYYKGGQALPDRYALEARHAPHYGLPALPHVLTFQGLVSSVARTYRSPDEAVKHSLDNARYMRNDAGVMECIQQRQRATALLNWHLEPEDAKDEKQKKLADDLTAILKRTPRFTEMRRSLLEAIWYGKYGAQCQYGWWFGPDGPRIVVKSWLPVNGDKLVFRYDGSGQVGIRVGTAMSVAGSPIEGQWTVDRSRIEPTQQGRAFFLTPSERRILIIHKHEVEDAAYETPIDAGAVHGIGVRSRIYWTWFQKQETLSFLMEYIERSALGIEIWTYPWGNDEAESKARTAAQQRIGQGRNIILVPRMMDASGQDMFGIERIDPSAAGAEALRGIITDYFGHQIKRFILGQVLTSEAQATGLGSEVAVLHQNTFLLIVRYDAVNLEESITTDLVDPLKFFNFPWARNVSVRFVVDTESQDAREKLRAWREAWEMGAKLKSSDVMAMIGASMPTKDDEVLQQQATPVLAAGNGAPTSTALTIPPAPAFDFARVDEMAAKYGLTAEERAELGRYAYQKHAPKGGAIVGGQEFRGGEFIPGEVLERATPEELEALEGDGSDSGPSAPGHRRDVVPPKKKFVAPPDPKGKAGGKAGGFSATGKTNTEIGDMAEAALSQLDLRTILTPGKRQNPLDVEYDHSGWAFEVKAVTTASTEYKAKPKASEVASKLAYAEKHGLKAGMILAVVDMRKRQMHVYWREGIGAFRLSRTGQGWNHMGIVKLGRRK